MANPPGPKGASHSNGIAERHVDLVKTDISDRAKWGAILSLKQY